MTMTQVKTAKYSVIKQYICEKIESGQWLEHSKVPSENELTEQFSVSRMTARRALQELTEQRFVNPKLVTQYLSQDFTQITPHEYLSSEAPLTEATHEVEAILASKDVCELLNISNVTPCLQVKRRTWSSQGVVSLAILTSPGNKYRLGSHLVF